jgi:hypothetical protein
MRKGLRLRERQIEKERVLEKEREKKDC